jgi:hypothetical protein
VKAKNKSWEKIFCFLLFLEVRATEKRGEEKEKVGRVTPMSRREQKQQQ